MRPSQTSPSLRGRDHRRKISRVATMALVAVPAILLSGTGHLGAVFAQPAPRQETEYGKLRSGNRPPPACHWERNYKTGTSAWVCRTKENYDVAPRYPRIVPRYQEQRRQ